MRQPRLCKIWRVVIACGHLSAVRGVDLAFSSSEPKPPFSLIPCHIHTAVHVVATSKTDKLVATKEDLQRSLLTEYQSIKPTRNSMIAQSRRTNGVQAMAESFLVGVSWPSNRNKSIVASTAAMTAVMAELQRNASAELDIDVVHG